MSWLLPPGASTFAGSIDPLYYLILVITGIAFVVVEVGLVWFLIKYRRRPGQKAHYTHGNNRVEIIWTSIPAITVVIIGLLSAGTWDEIKGRDSVPPDAMPIAIHAKQFEWQITYPGADGRLGSADDFQLRNQLHLPVDRPVVATLTAEEAIHSFFVPAFRIKQDAVPGMAIRVWFQPTKTGQYELACAELCGLGHYRMKAAVTVHEQEEYGRWVASRGRRVATTQ
ncbi:MAG: cytochrome c oxidase subunit II [Gemmatimonadota bacterium]|nr:cytochrome c oxidase subunit II [Gemmatimonadota bacterium]